MKLKEEEEGREEEEEVVEERKRRESIELKTKKMAEMKTKAAR